MTVGPIVAGLGIAWLSTIGPGAQYVTNVLPGVCLFALGLAAVVAPLTTTVMSSVDEAHSGIASAVNNAVTRAAGLIVVALLGLFGTANVYSFGMILCAAMVMAAGVISWLVIQNPPKPATD
jgi:hypothetical protein